MQDPDAMYHPERFKQQSRDERWEAPGNRIQERDEQLANPQARSYTSNPQHADEPQTQAQQNEPAELPVEVVSGTCTSWGRSQGSQEHVELDDGTGNTSEVHDVWGYAVWSNGAVTPIVYSTGRYRRLFTVGWETDWSFVTVGGAV